MINFFELLNNLPEVSQSRMVSSGYGLWVGWSGKLNPAVFQTLTDHGGLKIVEEEHQALWIFLSKEAFRAVARLQIWARLNPMPVFVEVFQANLLVDYRLNLSASVPPELSNQRIQDPSEFEVLAHPQLKEVIQKIPGLDLKEGREVKGLSSVKWMQFHADQGLDYESDLKWFFFIRPLGNPADKKFITGWRAFFTEIQTILQRFGFKYMTKDEFTIFPIDSLRLMRQFCREIILLTKKAKSEEEGMYWPAVYAGIMQDGLNFNEELPKKINLDWRKLSPDFPHLRYRSAFLLGDGFKLNDIGYGSSQETVDSWCNVAYVGEDADALEEGILDVTVPRILFTGDESECFYCGLKNHKPQECPSRALEKWNPKVWHKLSRVSMDDLQEGFQGIEKNLNAENGLEGIRERLHGKGLEGLIIQAIYEINSPAQHRVLKLVWRSRGKEWPSGLNQLATEGGEYLWNALDILTEGDPEQAEDLLRQASLKYTRSFQPRSLQGVVSLEKEDMDQAKFFWAEAERLSYTPLQSSYFHYLQARLHEVLGEYPEAIELYKKTQTTSPAWIDPMYREAVCMVKRGFSEQAVGDFHRLVVRDPNIFNRMLIDPELERGRLHLMGALWRIWKEAEDEAQKEREGVAQIADEVGQWFEDSHDFQEVAQKHLQRLQRLAKINNYVAFKEMVKGREKLTQEIEKRVDAEIRQIDARVDILFERLKEIQKEASWFPFPKLLHDFNQDFNFCAEKLNWIRMQHLKIAENFRKAQRYVKDIEDRLKTLQSRLVTLRIVRDSTLFALMLGRNFIWLELVCLGLALISVPALVYFSKDLEGIWIVDMVMKQRWEFQKGLVMVLSIMALAFAALKTALGFEKRKRELFERSEEEREDRRRNEADRKERLRAQRRLRKKQAEAAESKK